MRRIFRFWSPLLLAALLAGLLPGCRAPDGGGDGSGGAAGGTGELAELSALLREGSKPGTISEEKKAELEGLMLLVLPPLEGDRAGKEWGVTYHDMEDTDFFQVDLRDAGEGFGQGDIWFHILYRSDMTPEQRASYGAEDFGEDRGMGMEDVHYFIMVGSMEIRAVAASDEYKDDAKIKGTLRDFDLDAIRKL